MRTVDRNKVARPAVLDPVATASEVLAYSTAGNAQAVKSSIYGHQTVVTALKQLYLSKCSLCEADAKKDGEVEHFLPHHPQRATRAYDWTNLHWTCKKCNQRKRKDEFKEYCPGTKIVERTLLIDPTNPGGTPVEGMLSFDASLRARSTPIFQADQLAAKSVDFLNDSIPLQDRSATAHKMKDLLIDFGCVKEWKALLAATPINPETRPDPAFARDSLNFADRVFALFLAEWAPFCTSMRCVIAGLGLSVDEIANLGREHRSRAGIAPLY